MGDIPTNDDLFQDGYRSGYDDGYFYGGEDAETRMRRTALEWVYELMVERHGLLAAKDFFRDWARAKGMETEAIEKFLKDKNK